MLAAGCQDRAVLKKSPRIARQYRLIFLPDEREHIVYLTLVRAPRTCVRVICSFQPVPFMMFSTGCQYEESMVPMLTETPVVSEQQQRIDHFHLYVCGTRVPCPVS